MKTYRANDTEFRIRPDWLSGIAGAKPSPHYWIEYRTYRYVPRFPNLPDFIFGWWFILEPSDWKAPRFQNGLSDCPYSSREEAEKAITNFIQKIKEEEQIKGALIAERERFLNANPPYVVREKND